MLGVVLFIAGFTVVFMAVTILGGTLGRFFLQYADPERSAALRAPGARFQPLSWDWALNDQG